MDKHTLPPSLRRRLKALNLTPDQANDLADCGLIEHLDVLLAWQADDQYEVNELVDGCLLRLEALREAPAADVAALDWIESLSQSPQCGDVLSNLLRSGVR